MMSALKAKCCLYFILLLLTVGAGCRREDVEVPPTPETAYLTIIHASNHNGGYTFYLDGKRMSFLTGIAYFDAYLPVSPGKSTLEVRDYDGLLVWKQDIELRAHEHYTAFLLGDRVSEIADRNLKVVVVNDDYYTGPGKAKVRIIQAAPTGPLVNALANDKPWISNLAYGTPTEFLELHANVTNFLEVASASGNVNLMRFGYPYQAGTIYVVILSALNSGPGTSTKMHLIEFRSSNHL